MQLVTGNKYSFYCKETYAWKYDTFEYCNKNAFFCCWDLLHLSKEVIKHESSADS